MLMRVRPNIDLICVLVLIFLCGLLSVSDDTDYSKMLQTKFSSSKFASKYFLFTFNTAVEHYCSIGQSKLQVLQYLIIHVADS